MLAVERLGPSRELGPLVAGILEHGAAGRRALWHRPANDRHGHDRRHQQTEQGEDWPASLQLVAETHHDQQPQRQEPPPPTAQERPLGGTDQEASRHQPSPQLVHRCDPRCCLDDARRPARPAGLDRPVGSLLHRMGMQREWSRQRHL